MFLRQLILLLLSWGIMFVSELLFPVIDEHFSLSHDWMTLVLFRPFPILLSFLCFLTAFLMLRFITWRNTKQIFSKGKLLPYKAESAILAGLGWWLVIMTVLKHPLFTLSAVGVIILYGVVAGIDNYRRNKRLKSAAREWNG